MQSCFEGICCRNNRNKGQESPLKRGQRKQKQMLYVTQKNNPTTVFLKSRRNERSRYRINEKATVHISCRPNNKIDRTQNTNEENGRQAAWKGRNETKLYTKLSKPFS